jgi:hypothetical protein
MNGTSEHNGTPYMARNMRNIGRRLYIPLLIGAFVVISEVVMPAHAQGPLPTPTPLPRTVATQNAAEARSSAAQAQIQQADADKARADEMRRNGEAQYQQAQADINAAREAAATQNAVMVGELIGRFESDSRQMRDTITGQAAIVETQHATIISLTNRLQVADSQVEALRVDKLTVANAYAATMKRADEAEKSGASTSPIVLIVFVGLVAFLAVILIVVLQRKPSIQQAAPDVIDTSYNVTSDSEEVTQQ